MRTALSALLAATILMTLGAFPLVDVHGQAESEFKIDQIVTGLGDLTPPSIPTGLTATAISSSQINLSWSSSTDDVNVTGYQVFRNFVQIATTTVTAYADTGLSPETTYPYTVTAFDFVLNISGHSATATATTLAEPVPPPPPTGAGVTSAPLLKIFNVQVVPQMTSAVISWETNMPSISTLSWGRTSDYEIGTLSETKFSGTHSANIENLEPGILYRFSIEVVDTIKREKSFKGAFITIALPDTTPPANVTNFRAVGFEDRIELSWDNPPDSDLDVVRIVRSDKFFPEDPFAGKVIYEGDGTSVVDEQTEQGVTYYYTAFARDTSGNYSSGSIATGRLARPGFPPEVITDPFAEFPQALEVHPAIKELTLRDFDFIQDGKAIFFVGDKIPIEGGKSLTVSIDYRKLPEVLKTIGITLTDPEEDDRTFSFVLRVNKERTRFTATIAPLIRGGQYDLGISVLDHKNQGLKKLTGELRATAAVAYAVEGLPNLGLILLILLLILVILIAVLNKLDDRRRLTINEATA